MLSARASRCLTGVLTRRSSMLGCSSEWMSLVSCLSGAVGSRLPVAEAREVEAELGAHRVVVLVVLEAQTTVQALLEKKRLLPL